MLGSLPASDLERYADSRCGRRDPVTPRLKGETTLLY